MREIPIQSAEPLWRQAISGAQILFVAFGALVLVPLLTGLNPSLALLGAGVGTLLFQLLTGRQVPIFLGSSFAFIAPIIFSIQTWGIPATMGALACVSLMYFVFAGLVWKHGAEIVHRYMPPVVVGPIIMIIGLSLAAVGVNMAMGRSGDGKLELVPYATALMVAGISFGTTVLVAVFARGFLKLVPILCGVAAGYVAAILFGLVDFAAVGAAPWFVLPQFVTPSFELAAILFMLPVALAPAIEHVGDVLAIGGVTGKDYTEKPGLHRTLAGDGAGVLFAGLVGGPPITTYSEVTGALTLTKNYNPAIMTWAAVFAVILAFFGKFNALLASIPVPVMGGIMMLMFGSVAAVGLNTLIKARVDLEEPRNLVIVSSVLVMGIGGLALNFDGLTLQGVSLCAVVAVVLNLILPNARAGA
ncbi:MAG TPA: uracil-xanthine permease family protein [Thauera aminoaromatica]|jgi:uracil permease|uniref:Uracil-xanthine permease n=3 Tax=Thauera aminoaromatica TaxID=164330 RepID=C4ZN32_THASP|nr:MULTISPECIES: uracil-xanthine permease family protein [Thauera]ACK53444.1 uracil-xanthine permease [Thauera aminoaromatica]ENO86111.1 uracil-xanthine permease [Thauera aminoaromatica S2]KIN90005.1 uracil-xanthine permease family protein [Thauera sp. SWB20]MBL8461634.1 uracil-xanthine permease [Thauera sp.]MBP6131570.1 uracil-xanthine permease [Thauera sp.]